MSVNTESENDKRLRLSEEMVEILVEIAESDGRTINHMKLDENGVFCIADKYKLKHQ